MAEALQPDRRRLGSRSVKAARGRGRPASPVSPCETRELREQVALGCRILALEEHSDLVWGHVSARDPGGRGVWMKAAGLGFDEIGADQVILVSWEGEVLEGEGTRHAEYPIHTELMRARPDVQAVVHTHAPWAVAFASTGEELRPISHEGTFFCPPGPGRFTATGDLILTAALGRKLAAAVGERSAALMERHGIVTCGSDVVRAVLGAILLERACHAQLRTGGAARIWSSDEEALAKRQHCYSAPLLQQAWEYLARRLER